MGDISITSLAIRSRDDFTGTCTPSLTLAMYCTSGNRQQLRSTARGHFPFNRIGKKPFSIGLYLEIHEYNTPKPTDISIISTVTVKKPCFQCAVCASTPSWLKPNHCV